MRDLLALVTALALSLAIIPVMVYLAPSLGMMDKPNERKVHDKPIPRVGGWGIILGALISIVVWIQLDGLMISYILGSVVLLVFGALDDRKEMGHYFKFLGQFIAVFFVVFYGGLVVTRLPFIHMDPVPGFLGISFTVISMVGMINAINHSDGLDGLAGGESMLSLCGIGFVSYLAGGHISLVLAVLAESWDFYVIIHILAPFLWAMPEVNSWVLH